VVQQLTWRFKAPELAVQEHSISRLTVKDPGRTGRRGKTFSRFDSTSGEIQGSRDGQAMGLGRQRIVDHVTRHRHSHEAAYFFPAFVRFFRAPPGRLLVTRSYHIPTPATRACWRRKL
jgi:hypothetical protein